MLGFTECGQLYRDAKTVYLRLGLGLGLELMCWASNPAKLCLGLEPTCLGLKPSQNPAWDPNPCGWDLNPAKTQTTEDEMVGWHH